MAISLGLKTKTHIFICSETTLASNIIKIKEDENFTSLLGRTLINVTGKQADAFRLQNYTSEYSKLISLKYKVPITPALVGKAISSNIYERIRSNPMECQAIVGGLNENNDLELFCIDQYGSLHTDNFCVSGYGLYFLFGIFDMLYKEDMNENDAIALVKNCLKVLKEKLVLETDNWRIDIIGLNDLRSEILKV